MVQTTYRNHGNPLILQIMVQTTSHNHGNLLILQIMVQTISHNPTNPLILQIMFRQHLTIMQILYTQTELLCNFVIQIT
jgi:hypothetical protein